MNYGEVCTGLAASTVAWHSLGWKPVWFSEIEPFPCKVLKHHYPNVPNLGNMLLLTENQIFNERTIDLLVGGTPCQSFSVAGLRGGLADDRGNLALQFCRLLIKKRDEGKPIRWFVWENVPGALSSFSNEEADPDLSGAGYENGADVTETADFAAILAAFRECGYCCAWRVLDAQFFGVPQRRRRVFVIGYFGNDWRPPAAVLFEPYSVRRDFKKSEKKGQDIAGTLDARTKGGGFPGSDGAMSNHVVACLDASYWKTQGTSGQDLNHKHSHLIYPYNQISSPLNKSNPKPGDPAPTLAKGSTNILVPFAFDLRGRDGGAIAEGEHNTANIRASGGGSSKSYIVDKTPRVRRLTPKECERLQGFPDNYTLIKGASDTKRYQAIGNSMAVPVMHWIGARIDLVDKFLQNG